MNEPDEIWMPGDSALLFHCVRDEMKPGCTKYLRAEILNEKLEAAAVMAENEGLVHVPDKIRDLKEK